MTYPIKERTKILSVRQRDGLTIEQVAQRFGVGKASVVRWLKCLEPKVYTLRKHRKIDPQALAIDIQKYPDAYQYERAKRFQVCQKSIWHALGKLGVTYKKNSKTPKSKRRHQTCLPGED